MKYFIIATILFALVSSGHPTSAQAMPANSKDMVSVTTFSRLRDELTKQYENKDFKSALSTLETMQLLINSQLKSNQKAAQPDSQAFSILYDNATNPSILKIGDHALKIFGDKDIFIPGVDPRDASSATRNEGSFVGSYSASYDDEDLINNAFCKINNHTEEIHYASSNAKVVTVSNHEATDENSGGRITVHGAGDAIITVTLAGHSLDLPIKVTKLPVYSLMLTDDLIKLLGIPDKKTVDNVEWPDHKTVDGIPYEPSATEKTNFVEHWFYNKYPKVVFAIDGFPFVMQISNTGW